jgi:hypothetical protein
VARKRADVQRLIDQRDQLLKEIEALRNQVAGIEMAITLLDGDETTAGTGAQRSVKAVVLDLLKEVGTTGLSAASVCEMAHRRGITLHSGSVGSTLSRLKGLGVVVLQGNKYVLADYATKAEPRPSLNIVQPTWPSAQS